MSRPNLFSSWRLRRRVLRGDELEKRMVWILGSPRTGSTWLMNLMKADRQMVPIDEPTVGVHLATLMLDYVSVQPRALPADRLRVNDVRADLPSYFFNRRYEGVWRPRLRDLLLARVAAEVDDACRERGLTDPLVVLKEPVGSQGADLLMSLLPASRMVFLLRDGRDSIDSELDGFGSGGWMTEALPGYSPSEADRLAFLNARAHAWMARTLAVRRAYAAHDPALRRLVRYEELLVDAPSHLEQLFDWLGRDVPHGRMAEIVEALSFERLPAARRGPGKFARAATPGMWRQNLSSAEQELLERLIGPTVRELGYA